MDTTSTTGQHLTLVDQPDTAGLPFWRRAAAAVTNGTDRALRFLREDGLLVVIALIVLAVVAATLWLAWVILSAFFSALGTIAGAAGDGLSNLVGWLAHGPITHAINDPVRGFLDAHTTGLPASGHDLWITWLATAGVLYLMGMAGSGYARIGWAVIGALTAAAAYFGAAAATGPAAAGLTAAVWLLLSLPVYARAKRASVLEQIALDLQQRREARQELAERRARRGRAAANTAS
ncbi:hypothetical protein [Mangrovihabitans endophyticus]|uniref:Uncharacterized protein n=1 Tax=Mangrovihabitans endophyticus TaxID=1751298 RepID=A0A8J3C8B5_9ACTN|nr:hypothetical protein [Mangrovihabitans endophyticus]GGL17783.1 hypothetical protein GCM10012284_60510 [Mangrovihabitans endophyticus]